MKRVKVWNGEGCKNSVPAAWMSLKRNELFIFLACVLLKVVVEENPLSWHSLIDLSYFWQQPSMICFVVWLSAEKGPQEWMPSQ
jgi:hypothetical protein